MANSGLTDLTGKRAIVTGASRGIGLATCARLAKAGARLALVSRRPEGLEKAAETLRELGAEAITVPANTSRSDEVRAIVPRVVEAWGGVDILVNNAATNPVFGSFVDLEERAWNKIIDTNVRGPFLLTQAVAREMIKQRSGVIVNVASIAGLEPSLGLACYSVSKAAVISMTKNFAQELGPQGIRVNCVAPGLVDTRFAELLIKTPEFHRAAIDRAALHRHGEPDEIARTVLYLCSDMSAFMTGAVMVVDGGSRF